MNNRSVGDIVELIVVPAAKRIEDEVLHVERCLWGEVLDHSVGAKHYLSLLDSRAHGAVISVSLPLSETPPAVGEVVGINGALRPRIDGTRVELVFDGISLNGPPERSARQRELDQLVAALSKRTPQKIRSLRKIVLVSSEASKAVSDFHAALTDDVRASLEIELVGVNLRDPEAIAAGLHRAAAQKGVDLVVVMRGGGSARDLMPFNTPCVVKAVADAAAHVPTMTAVGHHTDRTAVDRVASYSVATPSSAASFVAKRVRAVASQQASHVVQRSERIPPQRQRWPRASFWAKARRAVSIAIVLAIGWSAHALWSGIVAPPVQPLPCGKADTGRHR